MSPSPQRRRVAVLAHGAGSTGEFLTRAFGPALGAAGWDLAVVEDRSGSVLEVERALDRSVERTGATLVGGVSLGAHATARWAARCVARGDGPGLEGLLLVLPAWTGPPGAVAELSLSAATAVAELGGPEAVRRVRDGSWVGEELARAWPTYGSDLAPALRTTAAQPGPTPEELGLLTVPTGVVAIHADPFHPVRVAQAWVESLPRGALEVLPPGAPADDVAVLGRAAVRAWQTAATGSR